MEKTFISGGEYNSFLETARHSDSNTFDGNKIIEIYEYLKDKKTEILNCYRKTMKIENAHIYFLKVALDSIYFSPKYSKATEDFLKSDYLSEEFKKEICSVLNSNCCSEQLLLLNSGRKMSGFSKDEIIEIEETLCQASNQLSNHKKKKKCNELYEIFEDYIFVIDGVGPVEYIKEKYGLKLPIVILDKSGVNSLPYYYSGYGVDKRYLGEDHLFSIYQKIAKFYPDKADEFVKMVKSISTLTHTEFVTNYLSFVQNGMNSDFQYKEGNVSVDGTYGETRNIVGAISLFHMFDREQSDLDKSYELEEHFSIRRNFIRLVKEYKNNLEVTELQTNENNKRKVLT